MRSKRIERIFRLIQVLQSGRALTVDHLAEEVGVTRRTVFRDLNLLSDAGLAYRFDPVTRRYSTDRTALLPPVTLTHAEALAIMLATRTLLRHPMLPDLSAAASAALKVESMLPQALQDNCGPILEHIEVRPNPSSDPEAITTTMPILQHALRKRQKLRMLYDSYHDRRPIEVVVHPYRIAYIHRGWYLIAYTEEYRQPRTYKTERILRLRLLDQTYRIDPAFSLDRYFGNAWMMIRGPRRYHVKIRFLPPVAGNVDEITWHKTQRTEFQEDGSLIFQVDVDGLDEIAWWVLGYGDRAQVLQPHDLRKRVERHARQMVKYYESPGVAPHKFSD